MRIQYRHGNLGAARMAVVDQATTIAADYRRQGYDLTLRQLYYQFVARGLMPNKDTEYKRLGDVLNDARLYGLFDWDYMVDRTREARGGDAPDVSMDDSIRMAADYHSVPRWPGQSLRMEVWVEKEALAGVVQRAAGQRRVSYFSCRGYASASSLWQASQRIEGYLDADDVDQVVVLHLGDHDPSGIDMTRDVTDRLREFLVGDGYDDDRLVVDRIALNMDQVEQYQPPPNPAKLTDSRVGSYLARYGDESWELDALDPATLNALILQHIDRYIDPDPWHDAGQREKDERTQLGVVAKRWRELLPETAA